MIRFRENFSKNSLFFSLLTFRLEITLIMSTPLSTLPGVNNKACSILDWMNFAEYPLRPATIGFPIEAYSKIFEGGD